MNNIVTIPLPKTSPTAPLENPIRQCVSGEDAAQTAFKAEAVTVKARNEQTEDIEDLWDNLPV